MINLKLIFLCYRFLLQEHVRQLDLNFVAVKDQKKLSQEKDDDVPEGPPKKKLKGQNKHRPREKKVPKSEKLCFKIGTEGSCPFSDSCCYSHDITSYLEKKPPDIGERCYLFETFGKCPYSFSCRFGSQHIKEGKNIVTNELWEKYKDKKFYVNTLDRCIQKTLRRKEYNFQKSNNAMKKFNSLHSKNNCKELKDKGSSNVENIAFREILNDGNVSTDIENNVTQVSVEMEPAVFIPEKKMVHIV